MPTQVKGDDIMVNSMPRVLSGQLPEVRGNPEIVAARTTAAKSRLAWWGTFTMFEESTHGCSST